MWLPAELAGKLRMLAARDNTELGAVAGPILAAALSAVYLVDRRRSDPPAVRIAGAEPPADVPELDAAG